jgi:tRNA (guanine37-N1)-methyltransferase
LINFHVLTLFPEIISGSLNHSIIKRAAAAGHININTVNIRGHAEGRHKQCDDTPYGGGAGMVMMAEPIYRAYLSCRLTHPKVIYLTPQGKPFTQKMAAEFAAESDLVLLCGHYEGVDERIIEEIVTDEVSIGDYVLTGGELAACVVIDAVSRLVGGVLNNSVSAGEESFSDIGGGLLLEYPQYTRPFDFMGRLVPEVLLSGHHANIESWRKTQMTERTKQKRQDLYELFLRNNQRTNQP